VLVAVGQAGVQLDVDRTLGLVGEIGVIGVVVVTGRVVGCSSGEIRLWDMSRDPVEDVLYCCVGDYGTSVGGKSDARIRMEDHRVLVMEMVMVMVTMTMTMMMTVTTMMMMTTTMMMMMMMLMMMLQFRSRLQGVSVRLCLAFLRSLRW